MTSSSASNQPKPALNEWNPRELLWVAFTYHRFIAMVSALFFAMAVAYCLRTAPIYEAVTTVRVPSGNNSGGAAAQMPYLQGTDQMETDVEICKSANVSERVVTDLNLEKTPQFQHTSRSALINGLLSQVSVTNFLKSNILSIQAASTNPQFAADLANAWAQAFIEADLDLSRQAAAARRGFLEQQAGKMRDRLANPDLKLNDESKSDQAIYDQLLENLRQARIAENNESLGVVVVDKALPPDGPVKPKKKKILVMGLVLGFLAGFQLAILLDRFSDKVRNLDRLKAASGLPNFALIPDFKAEFPDRFSAAKDGIPGAKTLIHDPIFEGSSYRESFRVLRTKLGSSQSGQALETVSILSAEAGEGRTLANANFALSMAQVGKKVLLVDADFRKPGVASLFGIQVPENKGLPAVLAGNGAWKSLLVPSGVANLDLLPNRAGLANGAELLSGDSMRKFVNETKGAYDYVVFDGSPVLQTIDSRVLATLLDGVVFLARWNKTRSAEVKRAIEELNSVNVRVVGTILNYADLEKGYFNAGTLYEYGHNRLVEKKEAGWKKSARAVYRTFGFLRWFLP